MTHVALIRPDGTIEVHEEIPEAKVADRFPMLAVQVDLYAEIEGKPGYRAYCGEVWPPEGYKLTRGKLVPNAAE